MVLMAKLPLYNESTPTTVHEDVRARRAFSFEYSPWCKHLMKESMKGIVTAEEPIPLIDTFSKGTKPGKVNPKQNFELFKQIYEKTPIVANAFINTANFAIQSGYELEGNESEKKSVQDFFDNYNFNSLAVNIMLQMQIYGNAYLELGGVSEKGTGSINGLKLLPVETMFVVIEKDKTDNGKLLGYEQVIGHEKKAEWSPSQIIHFKWKELESSFYGLSDLSHLVIDLTRFENWKEDVGHILHRYGAPTIHYKLGTEDYPASQTQIDSFKTTLDDRETGEDLVTSSAVESEIVGGEMSMIQVDGLVKFLENQIIAGLQVPEIFVRGGQTSNKATADVELQAFDRRVKALRQVFTSLIEDMLIPKITGKSRKRNDRVKLVWNEVSIEGETAKADKFLKLTQGMVPPKVALQMVGWRNWVNEFEEAEDEIVEDKTPFNKEEKDIVAAQKEQFRNPVKEKLSRKQEYYDQYEEEFLKVKKNAG